MLLNLLKKLIGTLSPEEKQQLKEFIDSLIQSAASGAVQGAMKK